MAKIRIAVKTYPELELKFLEPGMVFQVQFIKKSETIPQATPQVTPQVTPQAEKVLQFCLETKSREQTQEYLGLKDRKYLRNKVLKPLIEEKLLSMSMPGKPQSPLQRYKTTESGRTLLKRK